VIEVRRKHNGPLRCVSGSDDEDFTYILIEQTVVALWRGFSDLDKETHQINATLDAMRGMKPARPPRGNADRAADRDP
jgi:hypothetical protein